MEEKAPAADASIVFVAMTPMRRSVPASVEPLTGSHEFTRHLVSLAVKYVF